MTAIRFTTTLHAESTRPRALARRNTPTPDGLLAVSHVEAIKRVCKFSLTIVLLTAVVTAVVALKIAIWIPRFSH